jgi:hypothetical protein
MDRSFDFIEYDDSGSIIHRSTRPLIDPADTASDQLVALGASRTGRLEYLDATKGWGPFLWAAFRQRTGPWPLAMVWIRETEPPWRIGFGLALRRADRTYVVGLGRRTDGPQAEQRVMLSTEPTSWNVTPGQLIGRHK